MSAYLKKKKNYSAKIITNKIPPCASWTQMKQLDLSSVGKTQIPVWAEFFQKLVWAAQEDQDRPMNIPNLHQPIEAAVCESGQLCSKNQSQQMRQTWRNMSAEVLLLASSLLLFPNEGVGLCRTNISVFSLSHFPSSPSYLVAFSFFSASLLSKQALGNEQWHLQDRI